VSGPLSFGSECVSNGIRVEAALSQLCGGISHALRTVCLHHRGGVLDVFSRIRMAHDVELHGRIVIPLGVS
jgi:hypothetical protein